MTARQFFGSDTIKNRFIAWGNSRGLYEDEIERIMGKVFKHGTYGRAWMTQLAADVSPSGMEFIGREMQRQLEDMMELMA
jgi:hypothetical protein